MFSTRPMQQSDRLHLETGIQDGKLLHVAVTSVQTETTRRDGGFQLRHQLTLEALLLDGEGNLQYLTETADLEQSVAAPCAAEDCEYVPCASAVLENPRLAADGTLETGVSVFVSGSFFAERCARILTDAVMTEPEEEEKAQLILSFCKGGDDLWSICKRYRAPVALVKEENDLEEDTLPADRMLLISSAT